MLDANSTNHLPGTLSALCRDSADLHNKCYFLNHNCNPKNLQKNADNNFVLLEQFSATACQNMLEQCEFIKHILLGRTVPKYFSCFGDQNYGNSKKRDFSDEKVLYREECKVRLFTHFYLLSIDLMLPLLFPYL
jgi:hypothetical protein